MNNKKRLMLVAVAGGLFFVIVVVKARPDGETIVVSPDIVKGLVREQEELLGSFVSSDERPALIARYVNDEILLREAYARELHRRDGAVRKRLLELMRVLMVEEPSEPTESDLRAYLRRHGDVYRTLAAVTFSHVFYSAGLKTRPTAGEGTLAPLKPPGEGAPTLDAGRVLSRLRAGAHFGRLGEPFWLGRTLERYVEPQLAQVLGAEFARTVMSLPPHEWSGPILSSRGTHFVRVDDRRPPEMPAFNDLVPILRSDWLASKREERLVAKVDELRGRYRVKIETGGR